MKILRNISAKCDYLDLPKLTNYNPLNPSFVINNHGLRVIYRGCNYNLRKTGYRFFYGSWTSSVTDNQNYTAEVSLDLKLKQASFLEDRHLRAREEAADGIQDLKVFRWRGQIYASGSGCNSAPFLRKVSPTRRFSMMLFIIEGSKLEYVATLPADQPEEKNWMPWVVDTELYFLYRPQPFRLLKYDADRKGVAEVKAEQRQYFEPGTCGSTGILLHGENYVGITHKKVGEGPYARYTHRLFLMTKQGGVTKVSEPFSFEGAAIEYGSGLAFKNGSVYLGYGVYDERAVLIRYDQKELWEALRWDDTSGTISSGMPRLSSAS